MNYYAWQRPSAPRWMVVALGGVFTLITVVCAVMIVHLLQPSRRAPLPIVATAVPQPALAPTVPRPATAAVAQPAPVAEPAPALAKVAVVQPAAASSHAHAKKHATHAHKHAVLAKREGKASRSGKSDIDRLLGL